MSLEENILDLTIAVQQLTAAIGRMQAPGPVSEVTRFTRESSKGDPRLSPAEDPTLKEAPNAGPSSDTTSGEQSQPTGESSSPELDYAKDVKPITMRLSREKGREITIGVLQKFDVQSAQQLAPGQWAEYIATCEKVLAGGEV